MDMMMLRKMVMAQMADSKKSANGVINLENEVASINITHNLGTNRILIIAQRINENHSAVNKENTQYRDIFFLGVTQEVSNIDTLQPYTYQNGTSQYFVSTGNSNTYPTSLTANFGISTSTFPVANQDANPSHGAKALSANEVSITSKYPFVAGRWVWRAYAISE